MTQVTEKLYEEYTALENKLSDALDTGNEDQVTMFLAQLNDWAKTNDVDLKVPVTTDGTGDPADPGYVKPGGWGANQDANTWTITSMKQDPSLFKVVDNAGKNVAVNFKTNAGAQDYIDKHKTGGGGGGTTTEDQFGIKKIFPDKEGGQTNIDGSVRYFTRHYASGKPDDPTCEYTIDMPPGHQQDLEATVEIEMTGMNHNDTIDWKERGPPHQNGDGKAWYCIDQETDGGTGGKHFQVERPHPKMHDASDKVKVYGFDIPNISTATFQWKGIAVNKGPNDVYIAAWINMTPADQTGWKKIWDVHDVGQIDSGQITPPTGGHVQVRIDGIKGKPKFTKGSVREIAYVESSTV